MAIFQVDADVVHSTTTAAQSTLARLQNEAQTLTAQLAGLQQSWSGSAASAFQTVLGEWQKAQLELEEAMSSIHTALQAAASQYADVEQHNAHMFMS
ncbi:WXG100 family type VII secretion target [Gryllotalpicola sp.]|uniref:WXG100 family type VII secretion target n=1 Tax=Gryllotalpicola sp. TaxID=1932787 RepID=UPI002623E66D|nr:WXG100 family type VII secretion target [Gryllotalpicola sp.]